MTVKANVSTPQDHARWALTWCQHTAGLLLPYVYAGGHGVEAVHPWGIPPTNGGVKNGPAGYDCSASTSGALWYAGVLGQQVAMNTQELEAFGVEGEGPLTVRVLDVEGVIHHAFTQLTLGGVTRYFAAQIPGTTVGFFEPGPEWVAAFRARRPA